MCYAVRAGSRRSAEKLQANSGAGAATKASLRWVKIRLDERREERIMLCPGVKRGFGAGPSLSKIRGVRQRSEAKEEAKELATLLTTLLERHCLNAPFRETQSPA